MNGDHGETTWDLPKRLKMMVKAAVKSIPKTVYFHAQTRLGFNASCKIHNPRLQVNALEKNCLERPTNQLERLFERQVLPHSSVLQLVFNRSLKALFSRALQLKLHAFLDSLVFDSINRTKSSRVTGISKERPPSYRISSPFIPVNANFPINFLWHLIPFLKTLQMILLFLCYLGYCILF